MNDRDRDLLFDLSEALLRRFAIIQVDPPQPHLWKKLLEAKGETGDAVLDVAIGKLANLNHKKLGPAVVLDAANHLRAQLLLHDETETPLDRPAMLREAVRLYIEPHMVDLAPHQIQDTHSELDTIAASTASGTGREATSGDEAGVASAGPVGDADEH